MSSLWIDSPTYVGPCRRSGRGGMRVFNRRRVGGRGRTPSLATLIRQMRMSDLNYADDQTLVRFRLRFKAAAALAAENNERACAQDFGEPFRSHRSGDRPPSAQRRGRGDIGARGRASLLS